MTNHIRASNRIIGILVLAVVVLLWPASASAQMGARVVQRNLAELAKQANVIVRGQVLDVRLEHLAGTPDSQTVVVTLRVQEVLKGTAGDTFTFRQYIMSPLDAAGRLGYRPGESLVLLMYPPSRLGLSSPVGLEQGRFHLSTGSTGALMIANDRLNAGLFQNIRTTSPKLDSTVSSSARQLLDQQQAGAIPYDQFKELVRAILAQ